MTGRIQFCAWSASNPPMNIDQINRYARRIFKESPNTRRKIRELAAITPKMRNGYNPIVVLAWFKECGLPEPFTEFQFDLERKWRWDFCWGGAFVRKVALEVQGGLWTGGAHVRPARMIEEFEKWNRGTVLGWRVLFCAPQTLCTQDTADLVKRALQIDGA